MTTNLNFLPPVAWTFVESENLVALIKRGESGYFPVGGKDDPEENKALVAEQNKANGLKPSEILAMEMGSMFGWDLPGANPMNHLALDLIAELEEVSPELAEKAREMKKAGSTVEEMKAYFRSLATAAGREIN